MGKVHQETALTILLLAACAAPPEQDPFPDDEPALSRTVGWLDEKPVTYGDVARYQRTKDPEAFARGLEGLLLERVTRSEAGPLGITIPRAQLNRATQRRMEEWRVRVKGAAKRATGQEVEPGVWLMRVAGVGEASLRAWVSQHTETELLQDRLLRYEQLTSPRVEVEIIVVRKRELAESLAQRARAGGEFAALAREHSRHSSAKTGGTIPFPLLPDDVNSGAIRTALFSVKAGAVVGPFPTRGGKDNFWQLYRIVSRGDARTAGFANVADEITRGLESRPVHVGEYERWRRRILMRHGFVATGDSG